MPDSPTQPEHAGTATFLGARWDRDAARNHPQAAWIYRLSSPNWQQAVLTSDGMFAVVSDYGNYAYRWVNWGEGDFPSFFARLSGSYLIGKIAGGRNREVFYEEETEKRVRGIILDAYRNKEFGKAALREVLRILHAADLSCAEGVDQMFGEELEDGTPLGDVLEMESWEATVFGYPRDAVAYCEKLFPVLKEAVRAQVAGGEVHVQRA